MKKFLILVSLIFFVSCENKDCLEEYDPLHPPKESDCLKRDSMIVENVELTCCYFQVKVTVEKRSVTSSMCYPFKKDYSKEDLQEFINDNFPSDEDMKMEVKKVSCKGSYLKFGFLLLSLLLI